MRPPIEIDPRLLADGPHLVDWPVCRLHLKDDRRFPWIVLVPRIPDAVELHACAPEDQRQIFAETMRAATALGALWPAGKINVGALGNIVRQLHIHVIVRQAGDAAWPGAPWIAGAEPYGEPARAAMVARLTRALGA